MEDSFLKLLCGSTSSENTESTPADNDKSHLRSQLFEGILDTPEDRDKYAEMQEQLVSVQQQLIQARLLVDTLQRDMTKLQGDLKDTKAQVLLREDKIDKTIQETTELKLTDRAQKRQISRHIQETDTLTKRILVLDDKNAEQRKELIEQRAVTDNLKEQLATQQICCSTHQDKIYELTEKCDDVMYEKSLLTAKLESLQHTQVPHQAVLSTWALKQGKHSSSQTTATGIVSNNVCRPTKSGPRPVPAPRRRTQLLLQQKPKEPSIILVGNSNAKNLACRINTLGVDSTAITYSSATCNFIADKLPAVSKQNESPDAVFLHAADLDVRLNVPIEAVQREMTRLISTAKRVFPASKVFVSSVPQVQLRDLNARINRLNKFLYAECRKDSKLYFINNDGLTIADGIHFTPHSRDQLARKIAQLVKHESSVCLPERQQGL